MMVQLKNRYESMINAGFVKSFSKTFYRQIIVCLLLLGIFSCEETPPPTQTPPQKFPIKNVNLIFESSLSMKGYLSGGTNLQKTISDLAAFFDKLEKDSSIISDHYFRTDTQQIIHITDDAEVFIKQIKDGSIATGKNTPLDLFFKEIINKCDEGNLYGFVSDLIYSPKDGITIQTMAGQFQTIFNIAKSKGLAVSIYQYYSEFKGNYWHGNGTFISQMNGVRPYYILYIGKESLLAKLNDLLLKNSVFRNGKQIHLGFQYNLTRDDMTIFDQSNNLFSGVFAYDRATNRLEFIDSDTIIIPLGINLSKLPYYYTDLQYLKNNLSFSSGFLGFVKLLDAKYINDVKKQISENDKTKLNKYQITHIVFLKVAGFPDATSFASLELKKSPPDWYRYFSTSGNDLTKTYAFEYLIEGAINTLESKEPVFEIKLEFSK